MKKNEKELFFLLSDPNNRDKEKIKKLLSGGVSYSLLGMLFENRTAAMAYRTLCHTETINRVNREFRNSLKNASVINEQVNKDYFVCVNKVDEILRYSSVPYALLKGAVLCKWYPEGCRTSNDIDVLVLPESVGIVSSFLKDAGFKQGYIRNEGFIPATRKEIIDSKMNRGETVPFIKEVNMPFIKYLEVDINFSLDYKSGSKEELLKMLERTEDVEIDGLTVRTLDKFDFILHLCSHLYKEATTLPWIKMKRDMTFYKYCDIYAMLRGFSDNAIRRLIGRSSELHIETELAYCLYSISSFYGVWSPVIEECLDSADMSSLDLVFSPDEKRTYRYRQSDPKIRFFVNDREKLLEEIENEKT